MLQDLRIADVDFVHRAADVQFLSVAEDGDFFRTVSKEIIDHLTCDWRAFDKVVPIERRE